MYWEETKKRKRDTLLNHDNCTLGILAQCEELISELVDFDSYSCESEKILNKELKSLAVPFIKQIQNFTRSVESKVEEYRLNHKQLMLCLPQLPMPIQLASSRILNEHDPTPSMLDYWDHMQMRAHLFINSNVETQWRNQIPDIRNTLEAWRDTEEEVLNLLEIFPVLILACAPLFHFINERNVTFIPLMLDMRRKTRIREPNNGRETGYGLLQISAHDNLSLLQRLFTTPMVSYGITTFPPLFDRRVEGVLISLVNMQLLDLPRLQSNNVWLNLLSDENYSQTNFYHYMHRFNFLLRVFPETILVKHSTGSMPLHLAAQSETGFLLMLKCAMENFPQQGALLLFTLDGNFETPYQIACAVFEEAKASRKSDVDNDDDDGEEEDEDFEWDLHTTIEHEVFNNPDIEFNVSEAVLGAACDDSVHIDALFFLLSRHPEVVANTQ